MMRAAFALTCLASTTLLACAAPAHDKTPSTAAAGAIAAPPQLQTHQDNPMPAAAQDQALLPGAHDAAERVLAFLSNATSTSEFTSANIGQRLGITLGPDPDNGPEWSIYRSPDLGQGWTYGAQFADLKAPLRPTFRFWFYHPAPAGNVSPVCALRLDRLRGALTAQGWIERAVPSEIGSVLAVEFAMNELRLTLTPRDVVVSGETTCVMSLQASGRH
jgi:hypothetical protein